MTDTSPLPASPSPLCAAGPGPADLGVDDLVIEDLSAEPWPAPTPGICICTISVG
ncbi:hypothetical protein B7755_015740 [Streptomyces sp. NBS 14/10]|uniref:hypothetical protein n=1 Tax=Streptomyces sp. NBS 14/10 TaxID=1945643 RepID=UPI0015C68790|nr:hypothetical protein [Streptomyces sp. NBS 14/10]KAK1179470.1 hypothetical protein B7755_015740 [Streptomyces sp. NBS 14/10]NUP40730.1 hypothetical protein [Streptomyces sp.]NUS82061.1 hypothetical protein [Streptomyces sp.]